MNQTISAGKLSRRKKSRKERTKPLLSLMTNFLVAGWGGVAFFRAKLAAPASEEGLGSSSRAMTAEISWPWRPFFPAEEEDVGDKGPGLDFFIGGEATENEGEDDEDEEVVRLLAKRLVG